MRKKIIFILQSRINLPSTLRMTSVWYHLNKTQPLGWECSSVIELLVSICKALGSKPAPRNVTLNFLLTPIRLSSWNLRY
jgi:hypothetical protein